MKGILKKRAYEEETSEALFEEEEVIPLLPNFIQEKTKHMGAFRGTAYHKVLELLNFSREYTAEDIKKEMIRFADQRLMEREMIECINADDIEQFLKSNVGRRIHKAALRNKYHAEQPFVLGLDAEEVYDDVSNEVVLIQGIIDVYFEENGELAVLDYKTDKVSCEKELIERYRAQLDYYAKALERLTGKHVKEKIIYSFTLKKEIEV